jgi:hypothetical protein
MYCTLVATLRPHEMNHGWSSYGEHQHSAWPLPYAAQCLAPTVCSTVPGPYRMQHSAVCSTVPGPYHMQHSAWPLPYAAQCLAPGVRFMERMCAQGADAAIHQVQWLAVPRHIQKPVLPHDRDSCSPRLLHHSNPTPQQTSMSTHETSTEFGAASSPPALTTACIACFRMRGCAQHAVDAS